MKRMLINATQKEEIRVAMVDGQKLFDLDIESIVRESIKSNIYKGVITRVEPSLEAAFVDYGAERHGFLPFKEISKEYYSSNVGTTSDGKPNLKDLIREGTHIIVQVVKEERGNKGAALTTFVSLAGKYLVLLPNKEKSGGISRRIEGDERALLRDAMKDLVTPNGMGVIARTAGVGRTSEELQWDLDYLIQVWSSIEEAVRDRKPPFLIYRESNLITRAMRDYLRPDINEVLIDEEKIYNQTRDFIQRVMPSSLNKIKLYQDETPLFSRYQVESQIETAFDREVKLPSGGTLVIDHTEALISIDINSARSIKGNDIEETALKTNLEAAEEIARQLRLRDLGGLVVIDFIDMAQAKNQREVEAKMRDVLRLDRARVQIGKISKFGLLEMSRQRLRASLGETNSVPCPRCKGQGSIRNIRSLALSVLRVIEEEAMKEKTEQVRAVLPVSIATFLSNEKRDQISDIENRHKTTILLLPHPDIQTPYYKVERKRQDQLDEEGFEVSYRVDISNYENENEQGVAPSLPVEEAAVKHIMPKAIDRDKIKKPSIFAKLANKIRAIFSSKKSNRNKNLKAKNSKGKNTKGNKASTKAKNAVTQQKRTTQKRNANNSANKNSNNKNVAREKSSNAKENNANNKSQVRNPRNRQRNKKNNANDANKQNNAKVETSVGVYSEEHSKEEKNLTNKQKAVVDDAQKQLDTPVSSEKQVFSDNTIENKNFEKDTIDIVIPAPKVESESSVVVDPVQNDINTNATTSGRASNDPRETRKTK